MPFTDDAPLLPGWVSDLFAGGNGVAATRTNGIALRVQRTPPADAPGWLLAAATVEGAARLSDDQLRRQTRHLYRKLQHSVDTGPWRPVRCWNFIPHINGPAGDGLDRYMMFNAGRYQALREWYAEPRALSRSLPTATGVGHQGGDLRVYCLASDRPARAVENPRQCPAYRYSRRYGPSPPCFSRATVVELVDSQSLMIGGTAAVLGEDSHHHHCLHGQIGETFVNLEALAAQASGGTTALAEAARELRIFYRRSEDAAEIERQVVERLPNLERLELMQAAICRPELLVEIEGLGTIPRAPA